jgi:hypothetical protein
LKDSSGISASDEGALRAGFTAKERQQMNKVSIGITAYREIPGYNKKTVKAVMEERILKRPRLKDGMRGATLLLAVHGATVALVFHNFLGDKEVLSRKWLVTLCEEGSFLGWCKSCGLSGITNTLKLWQWISSRIDVRTAYFGRTEASYTVLNILANGKKKGACNSHNFSYENRDGLAKMFQIDNHIFRHICSYKLRTGNPLRHPEVKAYESRVTRAINTFNPYILFTSSRLLVLAPEVEPGAHQTRSWS